MQNKMCPKCSHYPTCKELCYPVKKYLYEKGEPWEKEDVVFPLHNQINLTSFSSEETDNKFEDVILTEKLESPFRHFDPKMKRTTIFIERFFFKSSFKDIAVMCETTEDNCRKEYYRSLDVILKLLKLLDTNHGKDSAHKGFKKKFMEKANSIPKRKKWYILKEVFGFSPREITEMDGETNIENVRSMVNVYGKNIRNKRYPKAERWYILNSVFKFSFDEIAEIENKTSKTQTRSIKVKNSVENYKQKLKRKDVLFVEV